jgi:hypothetical protein
MKACPKCNNIHNKPGKFCSRKCANSRIWSEDDKIKKSNAAKNSKKVLLANSDENKKKHLSELAKKQNKNGRLNFHILKTKEVKEKVKKTWQKKSVEWLKSLDRKKYKDYRKLCAFRFSLNNYPDEFDFELIKKFGWYKAKNKGDNPNGVSRDHMFSISEGFKQNVDPYLISHPANCRLMQHGENFKKKAECYITLKELEQRIENWNKKYFVL